MRLHAEACIAAQDYKTVRHQLGLSQEQMAYETGVTLSTIRKREAGETPIKREAALALRHLLANPPRILSPKMLEKYLVVPRRKEGDRFGLFTILRVNRVNKTPILFEVRCECGKVKLTSAASFHHQFSCGLVCPAYEAMTRRGSHVTASGDLIDKDGFPEY